MLAAVAPGGLTATVHGSGFFAVYLAGLLLSDTWARHGTSTRAMPEALSAVAEPPLFVIPGAAFAPLVGIGDVGRGIVSTLARVFIIRPFVASVCLVGSSLLPRDRALVSWGGLKRCSPASARPAIPRSNA